MIVKQLGFDIRRAAEGSGNIRLGQEQHTGGGQGDRVGEYGT